MGGTSLQVKFILGAIDMGGLQVNSKEGRWYGRGQPTGTGTIYFGAISMGGLQVSSKEGSWHGWGQPPGTH